MKILSIHKKEKDLYAIEYQKAFGRIIKRYAIYRPGPTILKNNSDCFSFWVFTDNGDIVYSKYGKDILDWMRENKIKYHCSVNGETLGEGE